MKNCAGPLPGERFPFEEVSEMNFTRRTLDEWLLITAEEPLGRSHFDEPGFLEVPAHHAPRIEPDEPAGAPAETEEAGQE